MGILCCYMYAWRNGTKSAGFAFEKLIITRYTLSSTYDIVTD